MFGTKWSLGIWKNCINSFGEDVADEVLEILKMLNENDFVQKVEHTNGQIPSIILYNKEQMRL
jgi:hypothetical protein